MVGLKTAVLTFKGYTVNKIEFLNNDKFESKVAIDVNPEFTSEIILLSDDGQFDVKLGVKIFENPEENNYPFYIGAELTGHFELEASEIEKMDQFAKINATSILFPYLRALISTVTANANVPSLTLPPANIAEMLKEKNENK